MRKVTEISSLASDMSTADRSGSRVGHKLSARSATATLTREGKVPAVAGISCSPVSIIIPVYNNLYLLDKYLPSVTAAMDVRGCNDELVIVDDCGHEDVEGFLGRRFPQAIYLRTALNAGFGEACNLGVAQSVHEFVLLLNSDVEVSPDFIAPLLSHFAWPDVFCVVPRIIRPGNPDECQSASSFIFTRGQFLLMWDHHGIPSGAVPVIFPSGACALFHKEKLRSMGGFDRLYRPFYWEDVDLGYGGWKRGWRCIFEPSVIVWHLENRSIGTRASILRRNIWGRRNTYLFTWKNITDPQYVVAHIVTVVPRCLFAIVRRWDWTPLFGLAAALPRCHEAIRARKRRAQWNRRSDQCVQKLFASAAKSAMCASESRSEK